MKLVAQIYKDEGGGYYAEIPAVPGTIAHGANLGKLAKT